MNIKRRGLFAGLLGLAVAAPVLALLPGPARATVTKSNLIDVRGLLDRIQYDIRELLEQFVFEPNVAHTQYAIRNVLDRYMANLNSLRVIREYQVVCDESTNVPSWIKQNRFRGFIVYRESRQIEYKQIWFELSGRG